MTSLVEALRATRTAIENESNWTQGARNNVTFDGVRQMCLLGAIDFADTAPFSYAAGVKALAEQVGDVNARPPDPYNGPCPFTSSTYTINQFSVARFNNTQTHAKVLGLIDKAIEAAGGAPDPSKPVEIPANLMRF